MDRTDEDRANRIQWECPRCGRLFPRKEGAFHCMYGHWPARDNPYELDRPAPQRTRPTDDAELQPPLLPKWMQCHKPIFTLTERRTCGRPSAHIGACLPTPLDADLA